MGQDGEAAAELVATIRAEHVPMKTWFMGASPAAQALRKQHGDYPGLWKEVLNWKGWKEARKEFLKEQQQGTSSHNVTEGQGEHDQGGARKRRSRWGVAADTQTEDDEHQLNKRRSRWGSAEQQPPQEQSAPLGLSSMSIPPQQQEEMRLLQLRLREINDKLSNVDREAARVDALPRGHRERSTSPPPVYGADGKRKNTRAIRWRERLSTDRQDVLEQLMQLNPATKSNALFKRKRTKKIPIPIHDHPNYNFIGLIIGPRGKTQKELESKTGCKIAIRGRGSVKEGARGRRDGKIMEGDDEPLHVVITAEDQRSVDAATDMITQMLVVIDDEKNMHKQNQLRELALLNGTLKEDEFCSICAEKGHRSFECPKRFSMNKATVAVRCAICGDTSHPTRDCTQRKADVTNAKELDSDYLSFMDELDGKKAEVKPTTLPPVDLPAAPVTGITILKPAESKPVPFLPVPLPPPPVVLPSPMLPPPPMVGPPPHGNLMAGPPPPGNLHPPIPPPPMNIPLPPPVDNNAFYGGPPQNQGGYGHQGGGQYNNSNNYSNGGQQGYNDNYGNQQQQPYGHHQQQQQHNNNRGGRGGGRNNNGHQQQDEMADWDYRSFYGQGGNAGGAGGFNWWEQN